MVLKSDCDPLINMNRTLLVTSSVNVEKFSNNNLFDSAARLLQTRASINDIVKSNFFKKIVLVDSTGCEPFEEYEIKKFYGLGVELEQLVFQQCKKDVSEKGKSWGEMQIMKFAFRNSKSISQSEAFFKISGRYTITNLNVIIPALDRCKNVFFYDNPAIVSNDRKWVSSIFFKVTPEFYMKHLLDSDLYCGHDTFGYLERVYYNKLAMLKASSIRVAFPYFHAISGTTGLPAKNKWHFVRSVLCHLGFLCFEHNIE